MYSLFHSSNDAILRSHDSIQQKKFKTPFKNRQLKHNPDEVIFNYFKISLSATEKSLLVRGRWVSLSPTKLNYADYLTNFKLFYRSIGKIFTKTTLSLRKLIKKLGL